MATKKKSTPKVEEVKAATPKKVKAEAMCVISNLTAPRTIADYRDPLDPSNTHISLAIIPGANFLDAGKAGLWLELKKHPDVVAGLDDGTFVELDIAKTAKGTAAPDSLLEYDSKMAVEVVKGTAEVTLLKSWLAEEDRQTVVAELRKQIKLMDELDKARAAAQQAV
jgi:hypothetical protein